MQNKMFVTVLAAALFATAAAVNADVILSTDFTGATVNGSNPDQADNINWSGSALSAPSSLSLENVVANQGDGHLFAGTGAYHVVNGYFGGNTNISRSPSNGQWGTTITVTVGAADVTLDDIVINLAHTGNGGTSSNSASQAKTDIAITITDTSGPTVLDNGSLTNLTPNNATGQDFTYTVGSPVTLNANGVYDVTFLVDSPVTWGHYAVFNAVTLNGSVATIPEPATLALFGLGGAMMMIHRRRKA